MQWTHTPLLELSPILVISPSLGHFKGSEVSSLCFFPLGNPWIKAMLQKPPQKTGELSTAILLIPEVQVLGLSNFMEPQLQSLWSSPLINKVHRLEQPQKENTVLCSEPRAEWESLCNLGKQVINCFNSEAHKYKSILLETKPNICNFFFQTFSRQRIWHRSHSS